MPTYVSQLNAPTKDGKRLGYRIPDNEADRIWKNAQSRGEILIQGDEIDEPSVRPDGLIEFRPWRTYVPQWAWGKLPAKYEV